MTLQYLYLKKKKSPYIGFFLNNNNNFQLTPNDAFHTARAKWIQSENQTVVYYLSSALMPELQWPNINDQNLEGTGWNPGWILTSDLKYEIFSRLSLWVVGVILLDNILRSETGYHACIHAQLHSNITIWKICTPAFLLIFDLQYYFTKHSKLICHWSTSSSLSINLLAFNGLALLMTIKIPDSSCNLSSTAAWARHAGVHYRTVAAFPLPFFPLCAFFGPQSTNYDS